MTSEEAAAIRWHGAKATLTSYMVHFDKRTKYVRYQGGWKKASEAMPDLYLREAQSVVLKAQVQTLDLLRRGAALQLLEGNPLDYLSFTFPFDRKKGEPGWTLVGEVPPETNQEEIVRAMETTKAFDYNGAGHLEAVVSSCPSISSLHEDFRGHRRGR